MIISQCKLKLIFIVFVSFYSLISKANISDDLFSYSLEELLTLEIDTASLTSSTLESNPSSITVITQDQIQRTPARNIIDILAVYVPGLMVISDTNTSPKCTIKPALGFRCHIAMVSASQTS